jgi:hypothetical protein
MKKTIVSHNILDVETYTNCPKGGDAGYGGVTIIKLEDASSTAWGLTVSLNDGRTIKIQQPKGFQLELYGDSEFHTIIEALEFVASSLKHQFKQNVKNKNS